MWNYNGNDPYGQGNILGQLQGIQGLGVNGNSSGVFGGMGGDIPSWAQGSLLGNGSNNPMSQQGSNLRFGQGGQGGFMESMGGWGGMAQLGLQGLGTIAGILNSRKAMKNSNRQFEFAKQLSLINLQNQTKSYNTRLNDLYTARGNTEGWSQEKIDQKIQEGKLSNTLG